MKNISKIALGVCLASSLCLNTSCIEETFPTSGLTEDQLNSSSKATEGLLWAMPSYLNTLGIITSDWHFDWGYGSIMHIRDVMTEDMPILYSGSGYDWYTSWENNENQGQNSGNGQFVWYYFYKQILTANNLIAVINPETALDDQKGYLGAAYAFRAWSYLDAAQMFEFLENDKTSSTNSDGNNVLNLTVPIMTEKLTEDDSRNNPRATREEMKEFILSDLDNAEQYIPNLKITNKTLPHLDVVYGLKARCYMWLGEYDKAKEYARKAIDASNLNPMNENDCLSTTDGFNVIDKWMWGSQMTDADDLVKTGIVNWTSWVSNETTYGYAAAEPMLMINKRMYDRISETDFRKKLWKAPEGSSMDGLTPFIDSEVGASFPAYASVKFRPNKGDMAVYSVGSASAYPLMRVEEMYFIEAEATAHLNAAQGKTLLKTL